MPIIRKKSKILSPARVLVLSFAITILAGTLLLMLPISSKQWQWTGFVECLFTSASATCVTGLSVFDTYTHWTIFGQTVIMLLIQVGGLGLVTLVTFFNLAMGRKMGLVKQSAVTSDISMSGLAGTKPLFFRVILFSLAFEVLGAAALMPSFIPIMGSYGVFASFFTAISAFCNAGFDLMGIVEPNAGLSMFTRAPQVLIPLILLIIVGGIGFVVWENFVNFRKTHRLTIHTKIVLITTGVLLLAGTALYLVISLLEPSKFGNMGAGERILSSLFSSASARTAGFTAADLPLANEFSKIVTMVLMFIGAAPGSTAGGVKVTTLAILIMTILSVVKGREDAQIFGHLVPKKVVYKVLTVFSLSIAFIAFAFILLYLINPDLPVMDILYEVVSAFSTTGLSSGVSGAVEAPSRIILVLTMFVGRVGPISLLLSLTQDKAVDNSKVMPMSEIMIG